MGTDADWAQVACSDGVGTAARVLVGQPYTLDDHVLALKKDGSLWSCGSSSYGQLGLGDKATRTTPARVGTEADWKAIASGDDYSVALKTDGTLWTWGHNEFGQLGLGDTVDRSVPAQVLTGSDLDTFAAVACGSSYGDNDSLPLKTSGELWAWGGNFRGQLGNGGFVSLFSPAKATSSFDWATIASGSNSFGITKGGQLWAWGGDTGRQLGLGDPTTYPSTTVFPLATFVDDTPPAVSGSVSGGVTGVSSTLTRGTGWSKKPVTVRLSASDAGSGISRAQISVNGGVSYVTRTSVTIKNGGVTMLCRAIDRVGNRSAPPVLGRYRIDMTRPKPYASKVSVRRGKTALLRYRVMDYSPCTVTIVVCVFRCKPITDSAASRSLIPPASRSRPAPDSGIGETPRSDAWHRRATLDLVHEREGGRVGIRESVHAKDERDPAPEARRGPVQPPGRTGDRRFLFDGLGDRRAPQGRRAQLAAA